MILWNEGEFEISTDKARLNDLVIHAFLVDAYWSKGRSLEKVRRTIERSLCFGLYRGQEQIGFGRVVSDFSTFAYIADVFVVEEQRGHGLGKRLVQCMVEHQELQGLKRWILATADAHGLYANFGFSPLSSPERFMEKLEGSS